MYFACVCVGGGGGGGGAGDVGMVLNFVTDIYLLTHPSYVHLFHKTLLL